MRREVIDTILSAWTPRDECLTYSQIKHHIASKGLIKETNDRSLSRWLGNLVKDGVLRKTEEGYFAETKPKAYQVFDYLNELRHKYPKYIYEGEVGGWISHICALTYLNFDETLIQKTDEKIAFDIISTRIGELFEALYLLRNGILKRRCGLASLRFNDIAVREVLFGFLIKSISENCETEEIVKKYSRLLEKNEKLLFDGVWQKNKGTYDCMDQFEDYIGFDKIEGNPEIYKKYLKDESLDIDKYSVETLIDKYVKINKRIEQKHKPKASQQMYSYTLTREESELENNYRTAILTKVAECIKALETSTEDFGIIITRHPATMEEYFTPEHILYESMKWAASPPDEEVLKKIWQEIHDEENFEGMVAERLSNYNNINSEIIEALRSKTWVKNELSKYGTFDEILKLYTQKRNKRLRENRDDFQKVLGMLEETGATKAKENESP